MQSSSTCSMLPSVFSVLPRALLRASKIFSGTGSLGLKCTYLDQGLRQNFFERSRIGSSSEKGAAWRLPARRDSSTRSRARAIREVPFLQLTLEIRVSFYHSSPCDIARQDPRTAQKMAEPRSRLSIRQLPAASGDVANDPSDLTSIKRWTDSDATMLIVTADSPFDPLTQSTVMYLMPEIDYTSAGNFAAQKGFLSISGLPALAASGHVSVSVDRISGRDDERTQIVVNIPRLNAEGHKLSVELLKLAHIIR